MAPMSTRALNRATLERQFLLSRAELPAEEAVARLLGLQAQNTRPPYFQLWSRLAAFDPYELSGLLESRAAVRMVTMRSTIHLHTADDALTLRPLVQAARERELRAFRGRLPGVGLDRLAELARDLVEERPRTMKELREHLLKEWPDADPQALSVAARCRLPLVQVTPRGLWGRAGQVALTTLEEWLGRASVPAPAPDATVLRYLRAFGPASVKDMQMWAGLTGLADVFERLRPQLLTFRGPNGVELFDLPDAPRPDEDTPAPPRFLPEFDNLLLAHADRTRVVPAEYRGRNGVGNQTFGSFLLDGFLAGIWRLKEHRATATLRIEPFARLARADRAALAYEGERLLAGMTRATVHDIGFGALDA
ncbi:winged helix DNA-binding domain-containing protein [Streptomyces sp. NBC_00859]|uniref:winged helix DNA-binding domain-containing protein n=1 Tax=Streptomyces sp. NBC_00859 TaxID=2903682 RepID=UPI00386C210F|nr:winged helix DNA-binding domain-containing protein [Streptomyces sp. NBC_00859]